MLTQIVTLVMSRLWVYLKVKHKEKLGILVGLQGLHRIIIRVVPSHIHIISWILIIWKNCHRTLSNKKCNPWLWALSNRNMQRKKPKWSWNQLMQQEEWVFQVTMYIQETKMVCTMRRRNFHKKPKIYCNQCKKVLI